MTNVVFKYTKSFKEMVNKTKICIDDRREDFLENKSRAAAFSFAGVGFLANQTSISYQEKPSDYIRV